PTARRAARLCLGTIRRRGKRWSRGTRLPRRGERASDEYHTHLCGAQAHGGQLALGAHAVLPAYGQTATTQMHRHYHPVQTHTTLDVSHRRQWRVTVQYF